MEYILVSELSADALIASVRKHIRLGWRPQGGISGGVVLIQAMVKGE